MTYKRGSAPTNVVKLILDPETFDQLKAEAGRRKDTMERTAYRLLQLALAAMPQETPPNPADQLEGPRIDLANFPAFNKPKH